MNVKVKVKTAGRKRRITGWTLLLLGLLVAGVWVASGWWYAWLTVERDVTSTQLGVRFGILSLDWDAGWSETAVSLRSEADWGPVWDLQPIRSGRRGVPLDAEFIEIALWPIPLLLWTPAALLLRSGILARRRAMTGECGKCGYDLARLGADAKCPECGKAALAVSAASLVTLASRKP